jgi:hypothetical protein
MLINKLLVIQTNHNGSSKWMHEQPNNYPFIEGTEIIPDIKLPRGPSGISSLAPSFATE